MIKLVNNLLKPTLNVNLTDDNALDISWSVLMNRYGLHVYPALVPEEWIDDSKSDVLEDTVIDYRLSLINARIVNTSNASWEQVHELREDSESHAKLQRLRRFFSTNFAAKSQQYIEDDLHQRLEDHESVVRKFGFETKVSILEATFNSKVLQTLAATSTAALAMQRPEEATAALAATLASLPFVVGGVAVKQWKRKVEFKEYVAHHPLGFVIHAKERLE